jgi:hypothetical protein
MSAGHGRGDNKSVDIRRLQSGDIVGAGPGSFLYHVQQVRLPDTEFARSPAYDDSVLFLCHISLLYWFLVYLNKDDKK